MDKKRATREPRRSICVICGAEFEQTGYTARKTCSRECLGALHSKRQKGVPQPSRLLDLTGHTYGELTAIRRTTGSKWLWRCSCGKEVEREPKNVRNCPKVVSCGHVRIMRSNARLQAGIFGDYDGTRVNVLESIRKGRTWSTNKSGATGVRVLTSKKGVPKYVAYITLRKKQKYLGSYNTLEEAVAARKRAEEELFAPVISDYRNPK